MNLSGTEPAAEHVQNVLRLLMLKAGGQKEQKSRRASLVFVCGGVRVCVCSPLEQLACDHHRSIQRLFAVCTQLCAHPGILL